MSSKGLALAAVLCAMACNGPKLQVLERAPGFLEREGPSLTLDGEPYRFVGFDAYVLTGCNPGANEAQIDGLFSALRPRSMVRTYAFEPFGTDGIDLVVEKAREYGHLLTLVLTDHQSSCGEGEQDKTAAWYESGFRDEYLPWVRNVVSRYADEPAVAMWEPVKAPTDVDGRTLRNFFDDVGGEIHGLDRHHLVEAGIHGPWAYGGDTGYTLIVDSAGIDVASFHDYDNQGVSPLNLEATVRAALPTKKPVVIDELGLYGGKRANPMDTFGNQSCISWEERRDVTRVKLDASFASGLAGVLVWAWMPFEDDTCSLSISESDPLFDLVYTYVVP